jgi:exosortase
VLAGAAAAAALLWVYWPTLLGLFQRWARDPQYSHGYLVPLFALYLLWSRRAILTTGPCKASWWGFPILLAGLALRFYGSYVFKSWYASVALLPILAGLFTLAGGWRALRWSWPAIAFLFFMLPMPYGVEHALALPLQRVATVSATYLLQTLGFIASAEGNTIRMGDIRLNVIEACSGLSMLTIFVALCMAVALAIRRPLLDKVVIFLSAVPIALVANITRITVTGILYKVAGQELAHLVFHDLAGWLMMVFALVLLWLEMRVFSLILVPV